MEQKDLRELEAQCIQEEPPACRAGCPLGVDGRGFSRAMADGKLDAARAILEKSMPLVGIVARLCEGPCQLYCIRKDLGGPINLPGLERTCVTATRSRGKILKLPPRPKKVMVIGAGPSGLTVAFELARKGYPVTVYHSGTEPGGWLRDLPENQLPPEVRKEELSRLTALGVAFSPGASLNGALLGSLAADAFYIGQDDTTAADLLVLLADPDPQTFALPSPGIFTGGLCPPDHPFRLITDIFQGREAAVSIDRSLQGASLTASRVAPRHGRTELFTQIKDIAPAARIEPAGPSGYRREEAVAEAGRCIDCQCLECVRHCVYLAEYKGYPKAYARRVYNNSAIVKGVHQANRFINSCSLCGQCETLCPNDFSMADLCLSARRQMVAEHRMPPSAHWFALLEMRSAQTEGSLVKHSPGQDSSNWLFFPGCQLSGIRNHQTLSLYDHLREIEPRTGIWLNCCGAPAHWSGRQEEYRTVITQLEQAWQEMGRPKVLTGCSTCLVMFRENLPDFQAESVWPILAAQTVAAPGQRRPLALSDPCTTRHDQATRTAVRDLLAQLGQPLAPLALANELTECCGFGGLMANADPGLARKVTEARVAQTDADMLTYCAMCRDRLAATGKPVLHILDLLFPATAIPAEAPPVASSARRVNRRSLKNDLLSRYPESELPPPQAWEELKLVIPEDVAELLEQRRILEDDVRQVLFTVEQQGGGFVHGTDNRRIASTRFGEVTFWVEYRQQAEAYHLLRCWSHRMTINQPLADQEENRR
jgi:Fe-S oxidoreductase